MRKLIWIMVIAAVAALAAVSLTGCYTPPIKSEIETKSGKILKTGDMLLVFHSGTEYVKKIICVGETIPVFTEVYAYGATKKTEVSKIKALEFAGEHQFKAQVVEGQIKMGDIAQKDNAACMVYKPFAE